MTASSFGRKYTLHSLHKPGYTCLSYFQRETASPSVLTMGASVTRARLFWFDPPGVAQLYYIIMALPALPVPSPTTLSRHGGRSTAWKGLGRRHPSLRTTWSSPRTILSYDADQRGAHVQEMAKVGVVSLLPSDTSPATNASSNVAFVPRQASAMLRKHSRRWKPHNSKHSFSG